MFVSSSQRFVSSVLLGYCVVGTVVGIHIQLLLSSECCHLLGMFAELRKATTRIGFVMSVRPSLRSEQFGSH